MIVRNLFTCPAGDLGQEVFEQLLQGDDFTLERIVSRGHATPAGQWYDQDRDEWVVLLSGAATIRFEQDRDALEMRKGDYIFIPAHQRHRVEWTDPEQTTVWLALHCRSTKESKH